MRQLAKASAPTPTALHLERRALRQSRRCWRPGAHRRRCSDREPRSRRGPCPECVPLRQRIGQRLQSRRCARHRIRDTPQHKCEHASRASGRYGGRRTRGIPQRSCERTPRASCRR
eukprot:5774857-Pyramimonas_sp.AAC.1